LQGEGQEFESPRLHHSGELSGGTGSARGSTNTELNSSGQTPRRPRVNQAIPTTVRGLVLEPSSRVRTQPFEPLIRVLHARPPTSGTLGPSGSPAREALRGRTLPTGYVFGSKSRSSISPSFVKEHPDPNCDWPPGQVLEGVKLLRARGGCLGAKSR
jgi:hypothetical protein